MKRLTLLFAILLLVPALVTGQWVLNNFDVVPDTNYLEVYGNDDANNTYVNLSQETTTVQEGDGALRIDWQNECYDMWGGWIGMHHWHPDTGEFYDFSAYTNITFWYYIEEKQSKANQVEFRLVLRDGGPGTVDDYVTSNYELWFSHHYILDNDPGWHKIDVKMEAVNSQVDATSDAEGMTSGFWAPGWGQGVDGDGVLDLDKIKNWNFEFSQNNSLYEQEDDTVSGVFILDDFKLEGVAPVNVVFFNGVNVPGTVNMHTGWSGGVEIVEGAGYTPETNAIKWSGGAAWDAVYFDLANVKNMSLNWQTDSVQFKVKADAGIGDLNLVFWDLDEDEEKADYSFEATYALTEAAAGFDGTWKQVKIPLRDFNRFAGVWDNDLGQSVAGEFDSSKVVGFRIGNMGQAIASDIYFDDVWTGQPEFDWTAPEAVTGVDAAPGDFYNLVYWDRVPGEENEIYNIYASREPITEITNKLEIVATGVQGGGDLSAPHDLFYPLEDKNVTFYYAVECVDAAGNVGPAGVSGGVTNMAQGVPTITLNPPANFAADGDFTEWTDAGIMPWVLKATENNIAAGTFDADDGDLTATVWLGMDADNLYVAADVIDDVFYYDGGMLGSWWTQDAFELFIALWDQNGKPVHDVAPYNSPDHEPDYKLIFVQDRYMNEYRSGTDAEMTPDDPNYHFEEFGGTDYVIEAKIPFDSIKAGDDTRFHPANGMRILFDLVFHDNDGSGHEGNLTWSWKNNDLAWNNQHEWTFTWIGDTTVGLEDDFGDGQIASSFDLKQNYPNPFNPNTTIEYSIATNADVLIEVYDVLGKKVKTLVNERKNTGTYKVQLDAGDFSSGVYFYRIQAGEYTKIRKMLLVK